MQKVDIAIIGAGPAGAATAIALARRGYAVALIEKKSFPREKLCGDFINPINWPVFRELGVEGRVLAQPHSEVTGFRITTARGHEAAAPFKSAGGQPSFGVGMRRALLDQVLSQRAAELGAMLHLGCRVERIIRTKEAWRIESSEESWLAKFLIGADGRNSWVAQQLGLSRHPVNGRAVGFQSRLRSSCADRRQIEIHLFPGGYAGVVGVGDGTITLGVAIDKAELAHEGGVEFLFAKVLAQNPHLKDILERSEASGELRSVYPVHFPKRRAATENALLVGDAARVSEPMTGEGVYFAMRSGLLAAASIDLALSNKNLAVAALAAYERSCRRTFRSRLALNSFLRFAVYRPALLDPFVRLCGRRGRLLKSLVDAVCVP
jgi:geranylgeranyl reductase family protein